MRPVSRPRSAPAPTCTGSACATNVVFVTPWTVLQPDVTGDGAKKTDVIIEAIVENLGVKQKVFTELEAKARPDAILATKHVDSARTDCHGVANPARLVGVHFFNPVAQMMLVEIISGAQTNPDVARNATAFVDQIDKLPLACKSAPGFWSTASFAPYLTEAMRCLDEGISPETLDEAALAFGMPMGPGRTRRCGGPRRLRRCRQVVGEDASERAEETRREARSEGTRQEDRQGFYWSAASRRKAAPARCRQDSPNA